MHMHVYVYIFVVVVRGKKMLAVKKIKIKKSHLRSIVDQEWTDTNITKTTFGNALRIFNTGNALQTQSPFILTALWCS